MCSAPGLAENHLRSSTSRTPNASSSSAGSMGRMARRACRTPVCRTARLVQWHGTTLVRCQHAIANFRTKTAEKTIIQYSIREDGILKLGRIPESQCPPSRLPCILDAKAKPPWATTPGFVGRVFRLAYPRTLSASFVIAEMP
jgi:hypothetical protein